MKRIIYIILYISLVAFTACGPNKLVIPESLKGIKGSVAQIDSAVNAMYGWEPRDSTYNMAVDTFVNDVVREYKLARPDMEPSDTEGNAIKQQTYDDARATWAEFKRLCDADKYKEALDFYYGDSSYDSERKNVGDLLIYLKHSTHRFEFYTKVMKPLLLEYKDDDFVLEEYIKMLQLEKAMEDLTISMGDGDSGYVPEVYPHLLAALGTTLVTAGRMDEAQDLFDYFVEGVYRLTGDALFANYSGTYYVAQLYLQDNKPMWALGTWDNYKDYLKEHKEDYAPDALQLYLDRIEEEMSMIESDYGVSRGE